MGRDAAGTSYVVLCVRVSLSIRHYFIFFFDLEGIVANSSCHYLAGEAPSSTA